MKTKVFSIYDIKTKVFGTPWTALTVGAALRTFADLVQDERTVMYKHPSDYQLYDVGEFDDEKAIFAGRTPVDLLGCGDEFAISKQGQEAMQKLQSFLPAPGVISDEEKKEA